MVTDAVFFRDREGRYCARVGDGPVIRADTCSVMMDLASAHVFDALRKPRPVHPVESVGVPSEISGR